jgi:putative ABC transport system ATP-binding protein
MKIPRAGAAGRIGVVLQAFHLLPTMTALENVMTPLELAGMDHAEDRAREELSAVGLSHRHSLPHPIVGRRTATRGHRPRARPPDCLPTSPPAISTMRRGADHRLLFARRAETGATLVIITHDEALAARAQRIIRLSDGVIVSDEQTNVSDEIV